MSQSTLDTGSLERLEQLWQLETLRVAGEKVVVQNTSRHTIKLPQEFSITAREVADITEKVYGTDERRMFTDIKSFICAGALKLVKPCDLKRTMFDSKNSRRAAILAQRARS